MRVVLSILTCMFFISVSTFAAPRAYFPTQGNARAVIDGKLFIMKWHESGLNLGDAFMSNPQAQKLYEEYQTANAWANGFAWASLFAVVGYIITTDKDHMDSKTLAIVGGVPAVISKNFYNNGQSKLQRAFNVYNGVPIELAMDLNKSSLPNLALTFSF